MKQILCYLFGALDYGCVYREGPDAALLVYSDHTDDVDNRRSTTGGVFFIGGSVIT